VRHGNAVDGSAIALHTGVAEVLRQHKYFALSLGIPSDEQEIPELMRLLDGRLVDGVILTRTRTDDPRVRLLQKRCIPFITHGRTLNNAAHAWLDTDNEGAFEQATRALIDLGHRRIALINGLPSMTFAILREQGFRRAIEQAQLDASVCPVHYTELTAEYGHHIASQLLRTPQAPSAMICATDTVALGVMAAVRAAGLSVGRDVSVMGFGNTEAGQYAWPRLASIDHKVVDNGRHIAALLLRLIAGEQPRELQKLQQPTLLMRESVAACSSPLNSALQANA
jgi:LacI family transcriptional regulator